MPCFMASGQSTLPRDRITSCESGALEAAVADRRLPLYLADMKFSIGYFAKPRFPGIMPALLATYTGDFQASSCSDFCGVADEGQRGKTRSPHKTTRRCSDHR